MSEKTVTSVLVPWNTCGAYIPGVHGVSTAAYFPFCFFATAPQEPSAEQSDVS